MDAWGVKANLFLFTHWQNYLDCQRQTLFRSIFIIATSSKCQCYFLSVMWVDFIVLSRAWRTSPLEKGWKLLSLCGLQETEEAVVMKGRRDYHGLTLPSLIKSHLDVPTPSEIYSTCLCAPYKCLTGLCKVFWKIIPTDWKDRVPSLNAIWLLVINLLVLRDRYGKW